MFSPEPTPTPPLYLQDYFGFRPGLLQYLWPPPATFSYHLRFVFTEWEWVQQLSVGFQKCCMFTCKTHPWDRLFSWGVEPSSLWGRMGRTPQRNGITRAKEVNNLNSRKHPDDFTYELVAVVYSKRSYSLLHKSPPTPHAGGALQRCLLREDCSHSKPNNGV